MWLQKSHILKGQNLKLVLSGLDHKSRCFWGGQHLGAVDLTLLHLFSVFLLGVKVTPLWYTEITPGGALGGGICGAGD